MTRIGSVTVKCGEAIAPTYLKHVQEDGEYRLATFKFDRVIINRDDLRLRPGSVLRVTHVRYRRAA